MVQCLGSCPNNPFAIGIGGDKKTTNFKVMDLRNNEGSKLFIQLKLLKWYYNIFILSVQSRFATRKLIEIKVEEGQ